MHLKVLALLLPTIFVSGCMTGTPGSLEALCAGTRAARADHAASLAVSPDDLAVTTGAALIEAVDAGCAA